MEKSYLENNYEQEGKAKDRMSMQVSHNVGNKNAAQRFGGLIYNL